MNNNFNNSIHKTTFYLSLGDQLKGTFSPGDNSARLKKSQKIKTISII